MLSFFITFPQLNENRISLEGVRKDSQETESALSPAIRRLSPQYERQSKLVFIRHI